MIHDFADWLSPMLVKELRQGMRSRVLTTSLFILQALLIFNVIIAFTVAGQGESSEGTTAFFWSILSLPLLVILPLSALNSVGGEIKNNTLELIFLTRLNAWRIVFGKWIAIVTQAALLAVTVLPYIALRYYLGGVNMVNDLLMVAGILVISGVMTAATVALSPFQNKIVRVVFFLGFFFSLQFGGMFLAAFFMGGRGVFGGVLSPGGPINWMLWAGLALFLPLLVLLMLGMAASQIAPLAENHAGPRRLAGLLLLLICGAGSLFARNMEWLIIVGQVIITPVCLGALSENAPQLSSLYRPFVRRGFLGRLAARFFTPGWQTGFYFTLLVLAILGVFWWKVGWLDQSAIGSNKYRYISLIAYAATLLLPPALTLPTVRRRWISYFVLLIASGLLWFVLSVIGGVLRSDLYQASVVMPPIAVFLMGFNDVSDFAVMLAIAMSVFVVVSLMILLVQSRQPFRLLTDAAKPLPDHGS